MLRFVTLFVALGTSPVAAHPGAHLNPHVGDPVWLPVLLGCLTIAGAVAVARMTRK